MRKNSCSLFGKKQIAMASVLALLAMGGLTEPSYGGVDNGNCQIARADSSGEPVLSESAVETLNKFIVPEQSGQKLATLLDDRLMPYGLSFASFPEEVRQQYLDATEPVCTSLLVDVAIQVTKMESRGASQGDIEEYIKNSIPGVLTKWADACVRKMVKDGIVEKYKDAVSKADTATGASDGSSSPNSSLLLRKYGNEYVSESVAAQAEALCDTDKLSGLLVAHINKKLGKYGVAFSDIPEKVGHKFLDETQIVFEESYIKLAISGSRMEADGASKEKIAEFITAGFGDAVDAWAEEFVKALLNSGCLDEINSGK